MKILEAIELLKAEPMNNKLANAVADCLENYLDKLEDIESAGEKEADVLNDKIDAVSEMADTMFAYREEYKSYTKALKTDPDADTSLLSEIVFDLEEYLEDYVAKYGELDRLEDDFE